MHMSAGGTCPLCLDIILDYKGPIKQVPDEFYDPKKVHDKTFHATHNMLTCFASCTEKFKETSTDSE